METCTTVDPGKEKQASRPMADGRLKRRGGLLGLLDRLLRGSEQAATQEDVYERLRRLEGDMRQLQLDWERTFERVRSTLGTLAKRQKREEENGKVREDEVAGASSLSSSPPLHPAEIFRLNQLRRR